MLLDVLLGIFVLLGLEHVLVPPDFATGHYLMFDFPYSHGLVASLIWSALAAAGWLWLGTGRTAALAAGTGVFSHFLCDAVEHVRGLPLVGDSSPRLGLGLWHTMPWALALELLLLAAGAWLFLRSRPGLSRIRRGVLLGVLGLVAVAQVIGQTTASVAPPASALAVSWMVQTALLVVLGAWVDRTSPPGLADAKAMP
jgi:hypothetical protein